jgi:LuxR family transcriptional regulator, maltose regulon positive regulatory protein
MPTRRGPSRATPTVRDGALRYLEDGAACVAPLGGEAWARWLADPGHRSFAYRDGGGFTARREGRAGHGYWYAYRKHEGALRKAYLGRDADLTAGRLRDVAARLAPDAAPAPPVAPPAPRAPAPLLTTKLTPPAGRDQWAPRPRLVERLAAGARYPLTVVAAPAGFGKTTLLSAWAAGHGGPVAWVTLDAADRDPQRFWSYLAAALDRLAPGVADVTPLGAATLAARLESCPPAAGAALILDDYDTVDTPAIHDEVSFLIDHLPGWLRLVVSSRGAPPLALARRRARGELLELGAADLRFTPGEAALFLRDTMRLNLAPADVAALAERTEGWITGLQLTALSLRGRPPAPAAPGPKGAARGAPAADAAPWQRLAAPARIPLASSPLALPPERGPAAPLPLAEDRHIVDYLVDEVLQQQPPATRAFLLRTAILDQLCGPLCEAVTGAPDAGRTLEALERANLFLTPLDDARSWYRYHQLFAEVLRGALRLSEPGIIPTLHRRAAAWYESVGRPAEAVDHALAAGDWAHAMDLIAPLSIPTAARGELTTLRRWLAALPDDALETRPDLCLWYAWILLYHGPPGACERPLAAAEAAGRAAGAAGPGAEALTVRAAMAYLAGDYALTVRRAQAALALLPASPAFPRAIGALYLANGHLRGGNLAGARAALLIARPPGAAAAALANSSVPDDLEALAARIDQAAGALPAAAARFGALLDRLGSERAAVAAHMGLSGVLREWNEIDAALEHARLAVRLTEASGDSAGLADAYLALARALAARGAHAEAEGAFEAAIARARRHGRAGLVRQIEAAQARRRLAVGRRDDVLRWAGQSDLPAGAPAPPARLPEWLTLARVRVANGQAASVIPALDRARAAAETAGRVADALEALVVLALAQQARGAVDRALAALARALALGAPGGYVRVFLDEGPAMAALLGRASGAGLAPDYVRLLLGAFGASPETAARGAPLEPLSPREREVLRLIAGGAANAAVAERLGVSPHTVKKHLSHIYAKLGVRNRTQAARYAERAGLP